MKFLVPLLLLFLQSAIYAEATAVVTGPEQAAPGDLIILDATKSDCDAIKWTLANSTKSYLPVNNDRQCVFASGEAGQYVFVVSTAKAEGSVATVAVAKFTITIGSPQPTPTPGPTPVPPIPPQPVLTGLAKQAYDFAKGLQYKPGEAAQLAAVFRDVAAQAKNLNWGLSQIASSVGTEAKAKFFNSPDVVTRWGSFSTQFFVPTLQQVKDSTTAVQVLNDIATGLEAVETSTARDVPNETLKDMLRNTKNSLQEIRQEVGK